MKKAICLIILAFSSGAWALELVTSMSGSTFGQMDLTTPIASEFTISFASPLMVANGNLGTIALDNLDTFHPQLICNALMQDPSNSCSVAGNNLNFTLTLHYNAMVGAGKTIEVSFTNDNGASGSSHPFQNLITPPNLVSVMDGSSGSAAWSMMMPLRGSGAELNYALTIDIVGIISP